MQSSKVFGVQDAALTAMPLTWDRQTPAPGRKDPEGTEPTPVFEAADLEGFEAEGERTIITAAMPYDLRPTCTGRAAAVQQLEALVEQGLKANGIAFAVIVGEPGVGKSRLISELVARTKLKAPNLYLLQGIADENAH